MSSCLADMSQEGVKLLIVNVRGKHDVSEYLTFAKNKYDIIALNEFEYSSREHKDLQGYFLRTEDARIAVIKINDKIEVKAQFIHSNQVTVRLGSPKVLVTFWYLPPPTSATYLLEDMVVAALSKRVTRRVHTGDLNARSKIMGDKKDNQRGTRFIQAAQKGEYKVANEIGRRTFRGGGGESIPDWTLVSEDMEGKVRWSATPARFGSDHEFIELVITRTDAGSTAGPKTKIKPGLFLKEITERTKEKNYDQWYAAYDEAVNKSKVEVSKRSQQVETERTMALKRMINDACKRIQRGDGDEKELRQQVMEQSKELNDIRKEEKKKERLRKMKGDDSKTLYDELLVKVKSTDACQYVQVGEEQLHGKEAAEALLKRFFPTQVQPAWLIRGQLPDDDPPFTQDEVRTALQSFEAHKAPGRSGVSTDLVEKWFKRDPEYVLGLLNDWLKKCIFPKELKIAVVKPLVKDKKKPPTVDNVRPITLSEALARVYEKLLDTRIVYHLEKKKILADSQYGYRQRKGAVRAATEMVEVRTANALAKMSEAVIQLDVKSAFDSIQHVALIKALLEAKVPGNVAKVISSYLLDREVRLTMDDEEVAAKVNRGVPQGSCLGPHLYILATNAMLKAVEARMTRSKNTKSTVTSFADDIVLIVASKRGEDFIIKKAEEYLQLIANELAKTGLALAKEKTKVMVTGNEEEKTINLLGEQVITKSSLKILGIHFSHDRKSSKHIEELSKQVDVWLEAQRGLFEPWSPLSFDLRKRAIMTVLAPKITYAARAWWPALKAADKTAMRDIAKKAAIAMTFAPATAGYKATTMLTNELPLDRRCEHICKVSERADDDRVERWATEVEMGHPQQRRRRTYLGTFSTDEEVQAVIADVKYFTDGSKLLEEDKWCVGAAWVRLVEGAEPEARMLKLGEDNQVFQAEACAIQAVMHDILERGNWVAKHAIFSDSLSVIQALCNSTRCSRQINEMRKLWKRLDEHGCEVVLAHVKAHVGVTGNETADEAAKRAATEGSITEVRTPLSTVRSQEKRKIQEKLNNDKQLNRTGRTIAQFFTGYTDPQLKKVKLDRYTSEVYTGHGVNKHSHYFGFRNQDTTCSCGEDQTIVHLLHKCPLTMEMNIRAATQAGITTDEYFGSWKDLVAHRRFHDFIAIRAKTLKDQLLEMNAPDINLQQAMLAMKDLGLTRKDWKQQKRMNQLKKARRDQITVENTHEEDQVPTTSRRVIRSGVASQMYSDQGAVDQVMEEWTNAGGEIRRRDTSEESSSDEWIAPGI